MMSYKDALLNKSNERKNISGLSDIKLRKSEENYEEYYDYNENSSVESGSDYDHDEEKYKKYLTTNVYEGSIEYYKEHYGITINSYIKIFNYGCLCRKKGCKRHPSYEFARKCHFKDCDDLSRGSSFCCEMDGCGCTCPYFCNKHRYTVEAKIMLATIESKELLIKFRNITSKRYWVLEDYDSRNDMSERDIIAGHHKIKYASDNLDEFRDEKYEDKLIYDSMKSTFINPSLLENPLLEKVEQK